MITILIIIAVLIAVDIVLARINADAIIMAIYITNGRDIKTPSKPLFKPKEPKETEEQKKARILRENIENYNGSRKGQIKI